MRGGGKRTAQVNQVKKEEDNNKRGCCCLADGNSSNSNSNGSNTMPSVHKVLQGGLQQLRRAQEEFNRLHPEQVNRKSIAYFLKKYGK